jgi:tRNA U34 2-thiouridine synthase MnmA/TrmU
MILKQGLHVEAVTFTTPFCLCDKCAVETVSQQLGVRVHHVPLGREFLDVVVDPPHGYGSQMNPCIDCRILMLTKADAIARRIGAECLVTGEVLDERPFSQRRDAMRLIEREAGLTGRILRPLSAKLLPPTPMERDGLVAREAFASIRGRRRLPQIALADEFGIKDYPCPAGGCLLTDPRFADRLRDHLAHRGQLTVETVRLLRIGRHFRVNGAKVIVGRKEEENAQLRSIAQTTRRPYLEITGYMGPVTLLDHGVPDQVRDLAAALTVRYSDAPPGRHADVICANHESRLLERVEAAADDEIARLRV